MAIAPKLPPLPKMPKIDAAQAAQVLGRMAAGVKRGAEAAPDALQRMKVAARGAAEAARAAKASPAVARAATATKTISKLRWRPNITWRLILVAALVGAITHLAVALLTPSFVQNNAFSAFRRALSLHQMRILPATVPGNQMLPYLSPDVRMAACRYDVAEGPVSVTATLPDIGWTIALHTPQGDNFYTVPAVELKQTEISFLIMPATDRLTFAPGVRKTDVNATQVTSPTREGLIIIRAPIKGVAYSAETEAKLKSATCSQIKR
jgi:uncharacterized membrane protein